MALERIDVRGHRRARPGHADRTPEPPMLALQRSAGNAAVARLIQRAFARDASHHVTGLEFTVGTEISLALANKAHAAAAGGVNDAELRTLRTEALTDDTINDDERMFLAGLQDAANASTVGAARIATGTKFTFSRASIQAHLAHARDLDQQQKDPAIAAEQAAAATAAGAGDWADLWGHSKAASAAVVKQMQTLVGPAWEPKLRATISYTIGKPAIGLEPMLETMLAAASDDTPGDRAMAVLVWVVATEAGHPMAANVHAGRIQVDQVAALGRGEFAAYKSTAGQEGKGDTIYVPTGLDINDVAHRSAVIHELTHASQDASSAGANVTMTARDQAELEAYRAGARYQLEQTAPLTGAERTAAISSIVGLLNNISMLALVLESRGDRTKYEPLVREINTAWPRGAPAAGLERVIAATDAKVTAVTLKTIRQLYGIEDASGNAVPGANDMPIDRLSGESVLDWIDRV